MKQHGVAIERWDFQHRVNVVRWLKEHYGEASNGQIRGRWRQEFDYGFEDLIMDEDVYVMYLLKWS